MDCVRRWVGVLFCLLSCVGCGGDSQSCSDPSCADDGGVGGSSDTCGLDVSMEALAQTPRERRSLELMAAGHGTGITADQDMYERIVRDIEGIRSASGRVASVDYRPWHDGQTLYLRVNEQTLASIVEEEYSHWDCLNELLGLQSSMHSDDGTVVLKFEGIYAMDRVAEAYMRLPGIVEASALEMGVDGSTICLSWEGTTFHYVFDHASGDCPSGCTEHTFHHFSTEVDGEVTVHESWSGNSFDPDAPTWVKKHANSAACNA